MAGRFLTKIQAEEDIDWDEVTVLHERLERLAGSPVVATSIARWLSPRPARPNERSSSSTRSISASTATLRSTRAELLSRLGRDDDSRRTRNRRSRSVGPSVKLGRLRDAAIIGQVTAGSSTRLNSDPLVALLCTY